MDTAKHYILGNIVIEANCGGLIGANDVARKALKKDAVRGVIQHNGNRVHWSTLQQFEYHGGFTAKRVTP